MRVRLRFEPRDLWVGLEVDTAQRRASVCLVPTLPLVIDYGRGPRCVRCRGLLSADEQTYYGTRCERCEVADLAAWEEG